MRETKYVMNGGLAFSEGKDMKKLSDWAEKGWLLEGFSFGGLCFKLVRSEPVNLDYNLDYQKNVDEGYFEFFEAAGWTHVVSVDSIHIFRAPKGTAPIHSEQNTVIEKYENQKQMFGKYALWMLIPTLVLFGLLMVLERGIGWNVLLALLVVSTVALVFTGMPFMGYWYRLRKLAK